MAIKISKTTTSGLRWWKRGQIAHQSIVHNFGIKHPTTGAWNPQANAILECIHQVLGNCLQPFDLDEAELDAENPWDEYLAATAFAIRSTVHTTLGASPTQLVYGRDMILPVQYNADWATITLKK